MNSVTRYVITELARDGVGRVLALPAQGRWTWATEAEAAEHMRAILSNNSADTLQSVYRLPLEVRPCECWPGHFDPKGIYFD